MNQNMIGANHSGLGTQLDKLSRSSKGGVKCGKVKNQLLPGSNSPYPTTTRSLLAARFLKRDKDLEPSAHVVRALMSRTKHLFT